MVYPPQSADVHPIEHLCITSKLGLETVKAILSNCRVARENTEGVGGYSSICVSESDIKYAWKGLRCSTCKEKPYKVLEC